MAGTFSAAAPSQAARRGFVGLEQRLLGRWRALGCPAGTTVVVGFSGGADSLALAAVLGRVAGRGGMRPLLVHVDHGLRDGSDAEQREAETLVAALRLPFRGVRVRCDVRALHPGVGLEEAARRERYAALAAVVAEVGAGPLAVAHHEDDQAETVLLHLLRGAGLAGAAGMAERSALTVPWWPDEASATAVRLDLWRPFLAEPRATVRAYATGLGLEPVEDPTNREREARRNALRHEALPLLERLSAGATAALARFGRLAADDDAALDGLAAAATERAARSDDALATAVLRAEPVAIGRRMVRLWLGRRMLAAVPTSDRVEAVLGLADRGDGGRRVEIGEGWSVRLAGGALRAERATGANGESSEGEDGWRWRSRGHGGWPGS